MRSKVVLAKEWIEKTREKVKEQMRVKETIGGFVETFGFLPDTVEWKNDGGKRKLEAKAVVEKPEDQILGEEVGKLVFCLEENIYDYPLPEEWEMSEFTRGIQRVYKWKRFFKNFYAWVEIITE